ncbi:MAG: hypothetical protein HY690_17805 [Chloroflexi bacterium]|nr:hypothetical protein [Chloroflexota bacterium]
MGGRFFWSWFALALTMVLVGLLGLACTAAEDKAQPSKAEPKAASELKWPGNPASIPILGGVPNAPPRPTPTPLPAGAVPPPQPQPPAPRKVPLYAHIDTVTAGFGESKYNVDANLACVKTGLFSRGMHVVWRMELVDTSSTQILQAGDVENAVLKLPHGEELKFRFGRHGPTEDSPWYWTTAWDVPMDYPLGVLDYSVTVTTKGGKSVTVRDPLAMSLPDRGMDTRLTIVPSTGV